MRKLAQLLPVLRVIEPKFRAPVEMILTKPVSRVLIGGKPVGCHDLAPTWLPHEAEQMLVHRAIPLILSQVSCLHSN